MTIIEQSSGGAPQGVPDLIKRFFTAGRPGSYLAVERPAAVSAGGEPAADGATGDQPPLLSGTVPRFSLHGFQVDAFRTDGRSYKCRHTVAAGFGQRHPELQCIQRHGPLAHRVLGVCDSGAARQCIGTRLTPRLAWRFTSLCV